MAYSGSIGQTTFSALKVVDHAFRRCRLPAQSITGEMHSYALDSLFTLLSELSNDRIPSWCIEKLILPMYQNQPLVTLPTGTISVLNLNYRVIQNLDGEVISLPSVYWVDFGFENPTVVNTVGIKWGGASVPLTFQVSDDDLVWRTVGSANDASVAGEINWTDISGALPYRYFRITSTGTINYEEITLGNLPQEIPLGQLNRDSYVNQSNKAFPGRPSNFYFQRNLPDPVVYLWPAPFAASEYAQLILWRNRQIMDTQNLQQEVEIPQRWLEAIINSLAFRMAMESTSVDVNIIPSLEQRATATLQKAWDGDTDGSPIQINPGISCYTK